MKLSPKLANGAYQTIPYSEYKTLLKAIVKKVQTNASKENPIPIYLNKVHNFPNLEKTEILICFGKPDTKLKKDIKTRIKAQKKQTLTGFAYLEESPTGELTLYILKTGGSPIPDKIHKDAKVFFNFLKIKAVQIVEQEKGNNKNNKQEEKERKKREKEALKRKKIALKLEIKKIAQFARELKKDIKIYSHPKKTPKPSPKNLARDINKFVTMCEGVELPGAILKFKTQVQGLLSSLNVPNEPDLGENDAQRVQEILTRMAEIMELLEQ